MIAAGIGAGVAHCLLGPDHLAAVLPFAARAKKRAATVGLAWGLGHGASVLVLGGLAQLLRGSVDVESISGAAEMLVGVFLVGLGAWTLYSTRTLVVHQHGHEHDGDEHEHTHVHVGDKTVGHPHHESKGKHGHRHSAFLFGGLHGLAGTGHLFGVLPALMLEGAAAWAYLGAFLVGSVFAMVGFAALTGRFLSSTGLRLRWTLAASGVFSIAIGCVWIASFA